MTPDGAWPFWVCAYGASACCHARAGGRGGDFVASLAIGVACAHLGWLGLHFGRWPPRPEAWPLGFSVLFLLLGPAAVAAWRRGAEGVRHLRTSIRPFLLLLAVARLGCAAAGCCGGAGPFGPLLPLLEAGVWALAFRCLRPRGPGALPRIDVLSGLLVLFGALRAGSELLRKPPVGGPPTLSPLLPALAWVAVGVVAARTRRRRARAASLSRLAPLPAAGGGHRGSP